ncbi:MAG: MoxR family ATPase [Thaumarchaeota archaeon]|nr:MoxR family ATPase [Nitrososphaerota archaeon]
MGERRAAVPSLERLAQLIEKRGYVGDPEIVTAVYLSLTLGKPLLVEGEPGCGKTELAKVVSDVRSAELIRLQCYEGLDARSTIYEWDYLKQLLKIRMEEARAQSNEIETEVFGERFLLKRPLLRAVLAKGPNPPLLLIDEIDRADEEFEGLLLEFLGEFQVTVPEIGTFKAERRPIVMITSNRTRELGDGLRRRCLYLYLTYPSAEKELEIVKRKVPGIGDKLARQIVEVMEKLRKDDSMVKKPGIQETLDWSAALLALGRKDLDRVSLMETAGCVAKSAEDLMWLRGGVWDELLLETNS